MQKPLPLLSILPNSTVTSQVYSSVYVVKYLGYEAGQNFGGE